MLILIKYESAKGDYSICGKDFNMLLSHIPEPLKIGLQPKKF